MRVVIAMLLTRTGPTGVQSHVCEVTRHLVAGGVTHIVVTPFDTARALSYPLFAFRKVLERVAPGLSVWLYRRGHGLFLRRGLRRALRDGAPCVIYAQCPVSARAALAARETPEQRVVLVVHFNESPAIEWVGKGMLSSGSTLYRRIVDEDRETILRVGGLVFVSRFARDYLRSSVPGLDGVPHTIVPNFIEPPSAEGPGLPRFDLVAIGTLEPRKNQSFLLEVLAEAKRLGKCYSLALVGDGPDRRMLRARAASLGLVSQVTFLGRQPAAARYFGTARACVHGAVAESQGIALIEALASGVPVFAPAVGGIPEVFADGVEGRFWPLDDPAQAARILCAVLEDDAQRQRMSDAARRRFVAAFSTAAVGERLVRFLAAAGGPW